MLKDLEDMTSEEILKK